MKTIYEIVKFPNVASGQTFNKYMIRKTTYYFFNLFKDVRYYKEGFSTEFNENWTDEISYASKYSSFEQATKNMGEILSLVEEGEYPISVFKSSEYLK